MVREAPTLAWWWVMAPKVISLKDLKVLSNDLDYISGITPLEWLQAWM